MNDDVKDLLGKAFGQEPPLGIDRDAVLREGRKRLRRRRYLASGGVVAAVVVAAVGAATLTDLADNSAPERMPPAASSTAPTTPTTPSSPPPTTTTTSSPVAGSTVPPVPLTVSWAAELTVRLHRSGYLPEADVKPAAGEYKAKFRVVGDKYVYMADVVGPKGEGYVEITVEYARGHVPDCVVMTGYEQCEIKSKSGVNVLQAQQRTVTGEVASYALAVLPDGTLITARSSNLTSLARKTGTQPTSPVPPLDDEALCDLLVKSGLHVQ